MRAFPGRSMLVVAAFAVAACNLRKPPPVFEFEIRVESDPGRPVQGASVFFRGSEVGHTNADGMVGLKVRGNQGELVSFTVSCPDGFRSPSRPLELTLRRLADPTQHARHDVACPPDKRSLVIAVRAENGPHLPVVHLGREIARTDDGGAAHVLIEGAPQEEVELTLRTSDTNDKLRPQNPSMKFQIGSKDDVVPFDVHFSEEKPKPRARAARPTGPIRLK